MKLDIQGFKELLTHKMESTFESTGEVGPIVFFLRRDENVMIGKIPPGAMSSIEGKNHLADNIREICRDPITMATALMAEVNIRDNEGNKTADGIMLVVSTLEGDDITLYEVDCDKNKMLGIHCEKEGTDLRGRFTGFFQWDKN